jgi:hypothetical protein
VAQRHGSILRGPPRYDPWRGQGAVRRLRMARLPARSGRVN